LFAGCGSNFRPPDKGKTVAPEPAIHIAQSFDPRNTSRRCDWLNAFATCFGNGVAELDANDTAKNIYETLAAQGGSTT
jgi:hypothetical protein